MSNLVPTNISVPAHLANRVGAGVVSKLSKAVSGGLSLGESVPRISLKGARFRIVDGDSETVLPSTEIDVVIVGANPNLSKAWYSKAWTPDSDPTAPDCFSLGGVGPDPASQNPQNDLCATCPHNQWGSKTTPQGQKIKACADQKRLAVVPADDPGGTIYLLQVTPAALKGLNVFQKDLSARGIGLEIVRTRLSFDTNASFPKLNFAFGGFLSEETQAVVDQLFDTDKVYSITGEKAAVISPAKAEAPKPVLVSAPAPEAVVEEAPKALKGFGAAAAKPAVTKVKPVQVAAATDDLSFVDEVAALVANAADDA